MSEYSILYAFSASCLMLVVTLTLYSLGGRAIKAFRRYVASATLTGTNVGASLYMGNFSPWFFLSYPILILAWSFPYGSSKLLTKVGLRVLYGLMSVAAGLPYVLVYGGKAWIVLAYQVMVAGAGILLAVKNPVHAPVEEAGLCLGFGAGYIMYPYTA